MSSATARTLPDPESTRERRTGAVAFGANQVATISTKLSQIAQHVGASFPGIRTTFQLFDQPDRLHTVAASGGLDPDTEPAVFTRSVGVAGWVATQQSAAFLRDVTRDARFIPLRGAAERGALLCLPLIDEYACYGTMTARANEPSRLTRSIRGMLDFVARCAAMEITRFRQTAMLEAVRETSIHPGDRRAITGWVGSLMHEFLQRRVTFLITQETGETMVRVFAVEPEDSDSVRPLQEWALRLFDLLRKQRQLPVPAMHTAYGYTVLAAPLFMDGTLTGLVCYCDTAPITESVSTMLCSLLINASLYHEVLLRQLHEETERFSAIFSAIQEGVVLLDDSGSTILKANSAFSELIGVRGTGMQLPVSLREAEGRWWSQENLSVVSGAGMARRGKIRPAAFPDRTLAVLETPVSISDAPYRIWTVHDITALSRAEQTRSEFMSIVSHELRSPFTSINGYLRLLSMEKEGPLTPMQREALRVIDLSVRQLWRLIEDIDDLIRSDKDELELRLETVDIFEVVRTAVTSMMPLLHANDMRCELEIEAPIPMVRLDPVRVHQILTNLVNNAMKFSEFGAVIAMRAYAADGTLYVSVRDSGTGVPPEDRERIFQRFVKGQETPRGDTSGLGLGLAVVRELVEKHGGRVWVENAPEGGSIFTFTLPITPNDAREGSELRA